MLDPIHHQGLRLALGAFRTSLTASRYVEADEPTLKSRREKTLLAIDIYESKPNLIRSYGVRTLLVLESANINFNNIDKLLHQMYQPGV